MGHSSSKEALPELPSRPRLPKSPSDQSSFDIPQPKLAKVRGRPKDSHALLDESMIWKSPWTGDLLPKAAPEVYDTNHNRGRSFPSFSALQRGSSFSSSNGGKRWSTPDTSLPSRHDTPSPRSGSYVSRKLSKKRFDPQMSSQQRQRQNRRRESTFGFPDFDTSKEALSSFYVTRTGDTPPNSPIGTPNVPLMRRKSLRTPGIPMRHPPRKFYIRDTLSVEQGQMNACSFATIPASRFSRWPLCESDEERDHSHPSTFNHRSISPIELDYSHLGGFKRGSLRIMNRSTSPANSIHARHLMPGDGSTTYPKLDDDTLVNANGLLNNIDPTSCVSDSQNNPIVQYCGYNDPGQPHTRGRSPRKEQIPPNAQLLLNPTLKSYKRSSSRLREVIEPSDVIESKGIIIPERKRDRFPVNTDSGYSSLDSDGSSCPSNSPPRGYQIVSSEQKTGNHGSMNAESQYLLLCEPRDNELYLEQSVDGISVPRITTSPECHTTESEENMYHDGMQQEYTPPGPPRYYSNLGPTAVPPVPDAISIYKGDSDSDSSSHETDSILSLRSRRLSASNLKRVLGKNADVEDNLTSNSPRKGNVLSKGRRSPSKSAVKDSRLRSLSEPRYQIRHRSTSPSPLKDYQNSHDIVPPVPRIPSTFGGRRSSPSSRHAMEPALPRGRTRSRTVGPERTKLVKARQVSVNRISNAQVIDL
jgi:hypothetical protein